MVNDGTEGMLMDDDRTTLERLHQRAVGTDVVQKQKTGTQFRSFAALPSDRNKGRLFCGGAQRPERRKRRENKNRTKEDTDE